MSGYVVSLIYTGLRRYPIAWWQVDFIQGNKFSCPTCPEGKWSKKLSYTTVQHRYFMISLVFEVKIALKILIFFSYNLVDLQRWGSYLFAPLVDVRDVQEEYFYSPVRFLYISRKLCEADVQFVQTYKQQIADITRCKWVSNVHWLKIFIWTTGRAFDCQSAVFDG
jgi:hypothetical protein